MNKHLFTWVIVLLIAVSLTAQNNALHFDGLNDFVQVSHDPQIDFDTNEDFTVEVWVKIPYADQSITNGNTSNSIVDKVSDSGGYPFAIRYLNHLHADFGKVLAIRYDGTISSSMISVSMLNDDLWHHIAFVKSGNSLYLYIDGVEESTVTDQSAGSTSNASDLYLGRRGDPSNANYWMGTIDHFRIWDDARSGEEIVEHIHDELDGDEVNLVTLFEFNSGIPGGNNSGETMLDDLTGNGHTGALNNFALSGSTSNFVSSSGLMQGGNVGIGTATPTSRLHVKGDSWTSLTIEAENNDPHIQLTDDGSDVNNDWTIRMDKSANDALVFRNHTVNILMVRPEGRVGIGTDASSYQLEVQAPPGVLRAIYGNATGLTGGVTGVYGNSESTSGRGVYGSAPASSGITSGVYGNAASEDGFAVYGFNSASTGPSIGIYGITGSTAGYGVLGKAPSLWGDTRGVYGTVASTTGIGVYGFNSALSGPAIGTYGITESNEGYGVSGKATSPVGDTRGVFGEVASPTGIGVWGFNSASTGTAIGIYGRTNSTSGHGVHGYASSGSGTTYGVYGLSHSPNGRGIHGEVTGADARALSGVATGTYGKGLYAEATGTHSSVNAILASGNNGSAYAGYFIGRVHVAGTLSKSSGSFKIDHPLDPGNKYLYHSFVESPDMMNIYNGNVTTDTEGYAKVELPEWFEALNKDFRYQLTVIGTFAQAIVAEKVIKNHFAIQTDKPNVEVSWQVTGVRKDPYAEMHRIKVEVDKEPENLGKFLNPEVYGKKKADGINYPGPPNTIQTHQDNFPENN